MTDQATERETWEQRWERIWRESGNEPRPGGSQMGSPADVAARQWAALVASGRPQTRSRLAAP